MKKLFSYLSLISLGFIAVSCGPEDQSTGPENPEYATLSTATAVYYGDSRETGTGYFELTLGAADGTAIHLELFGDLKGENANPLLKPGKYQVGTGNALTFIAGNGETGSLFNEKAITGGTLTIEPNYTAYKITTDLADADGNAIKYKYEGTVNITDESVVEPGRVVFDLIMNAAYSGNEGYGLEYGTYDIVISGKVGDREYELRMETFSDLSEDSGNAKMTPHKYTVAENPSVSENHQNYSISRGFYNPAESSYMYSTLYVWDEIDGESVGDEVYSIIDGSFDLALSGDIYTIIFNFIKDDETEFLASYNGPITFVDKTDQTLPEGEYSTLTGDVSIPSFASGELSFRGAVDIYNSWRVDLLGTGLSRDGAGKIIGSGHRIRLEMGTPVEGSTTELPTGSYTFTRDVIEGALNLFQGGMLYGETPLATFYWEYKDGVAVKIAPLMAGDMQVAKSGDNYTITMALKDDLKNPNDVTATYTGPLNYSNMASMAQ